MLESLIGAILESLLELFLWFLLWPVALIVSTPFILVGAIITALYGKQRFSLALSDGYSSVSEWYKSWF